MLTIIFNQYAPQDDIDAIAAMLDEDEQYVRNREDEEIVAAAIAMLSSEGCL